MELSGATDGVDFFYGGISMKLTQSLAALLLLSSSAVFADEVEDQIQLGLEAYQAKDYKIAIDELNYAVAQMQEKLNQENASLLPEALPGWTTGEVENASAAMAMMGGGTNMSREYSKDGQSINLSVTAGSPMMAAALTMINNPMLINSDPSLKPFRFKRHKGMLQQSSGDIEITLAVLGQIMVQATGSNTDLESVEQYLEALDFDKLQSALLQ